MMHEMTMKNILFYESPTCDTTYIESEGMLCSSFETAEDDYYGLYEW